MYLAFRIKKSLSFILENTFLAWYQSPIITNRRIGLIHPYVFSVKTPDKGS